MVDQHTPDLLLDNDDVTAARLHDKNGFIFTSRSPITTKLGRLIEQHTLILP